MKGRWDAFAAYAAYATAQDGGQAAQRVGPGWSTLQLGKTAGKGRNKWPIQTTYAEEESRIPWRRDLKEDLADW